MVCVKKSALVLKNNLIANPSNINTRNKVLRCEATDFHDKEIPKAGSDYTCLPVTIVNYFFEKDESYYPRAFLKECKYLEK